MRNLPRGLVPNRVAIRKLAGPDVRFRGDVDLYLDLIAGRLRTQIKASRQASEAQPWRLGDVRQLLRFKDPPFDCRVAEIDQRGPREVVPLDGHLFSHAAGQAPR